MSTSHYSDYYQKAFGTNKANQPTPYTEYIKNKLHGVRLVCSMVDIELNRDNPNPNKIKHMFEQLECLSDLSDQHNQGE